MKRYAHELSSAMSELDQQRWKFELVQPQARRWMSVLPARLESAISRYALYPLTLHRRSADVFHVLDHGYGHLVRSVEPSRAIVTCHDLIPLLSADRRIPVTVPAGVAKTFRFRIREMARAGRVITISEATRNTLLEYTALPASRITVILYGVNRTFRPAEPNEVEATKRRLAIPINAQVILQVATRGRYKNTPGLLRAFAILKKRVGEALLVRVGVPLYDDEAALAAQLGVTDSIHYVGMVADDRRLAEWYRSATVLAFPSFWEGFGWPPLEAMASGTPVVASTIPAIQEVAQQAAALVDPQDHDALAAALERVITDCAYAQELRVRGLERARQLTWAEAARKTLDVYDEVAGSRIGESS